MDQITMNLELVRKEKRPSLAFVLGSGGIRSLAELPILQYVANKGIPIDVIFGSGGGAVLGALYACGYSFEEIPQLMASIFNRKLYQKVDLRTLLKILGLRRQPFRIPPAPYKADPILKEMKRIFGDRRLEDLPHKLKIQATDMATGSEITLSTGLVYEAVYVSNATYPFLPPLEIGGRCFASAVFTSAIPVIQAVQENHGIVIVISVNDTSPVTAKGLFENINTFFMRSCSSTQGEQAALAIDLHEGEVVLLNVKFSKSVNLWDKHAVTDILQYGHQLVTARKEEIDEVVDKLR